MRHEFSKPVRREALKRSGGLCEAIGTVYGLEPGQRCNAPLSHGVEFDHYPVPATDKGSDTLDNCVAVCRTCHRRKTSTYDVPMQIAAVQQRTADTYKRKFGDVDSQKDLSPVNHVASGKGIPPFLILHVADHPETKSQSQGLAKALVEAGVSAKAYPAEGKNHNSINNDLGVPDDQPSKALFEFLNGLLKP